MNVLSLFDGMSCGQIALQKAGIKVNKYFASEIKPHAIKVTQYNYPDTIQLGDIRNIDSTKLGGVDLLIGGSPCQDFSRGNKQRDGLAGQKSSLFFEYVRIYKELKKENPDLKFLLENVVMEKKEEGFISEIFNIEPISINSELVSPQLRERLYWTNICETKEDLFGRRFPLIAQPEDRKIMLQSIITDGFYTDRTKARALLESDSRPLRTPSKMAHRYFNTGFTTIVFRDEGIFNIAKYQPELLQKCDLRYLNQIELEICQTVPEGYTSILERDDAACLLGDGWTVEAIEYLFRQGL